MRELLMHYYKDRRVLVTGGAGFIGSHLVEYCVALGADVTVLDNFSTGNREHIAYLEKSVQIIEGDIIDLATCMRAAHGQQTIFHCAAITSVPLSCAQPYLCTQINTIGTAHMLEAAAQQRVEQFVFSSSAAVYGAREGACKETDPCAPLSPYGWSKLIGEMLCHQYAQTSSVQTICLRYFNVFGPRQQTGVVAQFRHKMAEGEPIIVQGDGTQERDFVPVATVVEANLLVGAQAERITPGEIFNIASGRSTSLLGLIEQLQKEYQHYQHELLTFAPARMGDIKRSAADCRKYQALRERMC